MSRHGAFILQPGVIQEIAKRMQEKQASRDSDEARLSSGDATPAQIQAENGFFSVLDRSKAQLVARRVRITIKDGRS